MSEYENCLYFIEDRTDQQGQWQVLRPLFDGYYRHLKDKGLKPSTIGRKLNAAAFFIINFLFIDDTIDSIDKIDSKTVTQFLSSFYKEDPPEDSISRRKIYRKALADFYGYLFEQGLIFKSAYIDIKTSPLEEPGQIKEISGLPALLEP